MDQRHGTLRALREGVMKPPPFEYLRPTDVEGVLAALARDSGETKILAGGQSLVPMMNLRIVAPKRLVDINRVPGLDRIGIDGDWFVIGALARHTDVLKSPAVRQHTPLVIAAYRHVAHRPIRNRGTIGGNLAHADPASELPAVMLALDAEFALAGQAGRRTVAASQFFTGALTTALRPGELLVEIRARSLPPRSGSAFLEIAQRKGDYALAGAAVVITCDGTGRCQDARIALCAVGATPVRAREAERALVGEIPRGEVLGEAM